MAKKPTISAGSELAPVHFKISKSILTKLPPDERAIAQSELWNKSAGICALCSGALDSDPELNVADHRIPMSEDADGTTINNLYLAHLSCNASRKDLPFVVAQPLVKFKVFSEHLKAVNFDHVLDNFVDKPRQPVTVSRSDNSITIGLAGSAYEARVSKDPATGTEYFFAEVPFTHVSNDVKIQPRLISYGHVRKLALDFVDRPVHEPGNVRLTMHGSEAGHLQQFDGQHKSTAQILLGRKSGAFKVYIEPDQAMLQQLVVKIQQEIKKQPLTKSDTLAKLGDVISSLLEDYKGNPRTEDGFVKSQPSSEQSATKSLYIKELQRLIFFDEDNELSQYVKPGVVGSPTTDRVVIEKIIAPLLYSSMMNVDMDSDFQRDNERSNIILILNRIRLNMLPDNFAMDDLQKKRTKLFFQQGSIAWWMGDILIPALRYALFKLQATKPLLTDILDQEAESKVVSLVDALCAWDVWSTDDPDAIAAVRSNTAKNVAAAFHGHTDQRLIKEAITAKS
ncbi:MAG: HNH endonuclease [Allorhizobium sp.]